MDTVVVTSAGKISGVTTHGITRFLGIPYAAAPEGPLRFQTPAPVSPWDGIRDAAVFGTAAPQLSPAPGVPPYWRASDGLDCLSLNVWTPDRGTAGLPVMVWFHGGSFKHGTASQPDFDATLLASAGVVVVTVNYRLGFEGFGRLPGVPDNRGLRDQIAALEWVRDNISVFGGDAGNVTVFGQSAGAASVALLMCATTGLFRRVIAQSIPDAFLPAAGAERATGILAAAAGVDVTWAGLAALPPEAILAVQDTPLDGPAGGRTPFPPVIDGDLVTGPPWTANPDGDVDLICGYTHDEARIYTAAMPGVDLDGAAASMGLSAADYRAAYPGTDLEVFTTMLSDKLIRLPTTWTAEAHARAGGRTWLYDLTWRSPLLGASHILDVPLTFGNGGTRLAARYLGSPPPAEFAVLSEQIRTAWTAFATTGDPGWPRFDLDTRTTRLWDVPPADVPDPLAASRHIWS
jgi:para-nitrobenzyl esterase